MANVPDVLLIASIHCVSLVALIVLLQAPNIPDLSLFPQIVFRHPPAIIL